MSNADPDAIPALHLPALENDGTGGSRLSAVTLERVSTDLGPDLPPLWSTTPSEAVAVRFIDVPAGIDMPPHPAPARQFVVVVNGVIEVESTDGGIIRLGAGDVGLAADVEGGHPDAGDRRPGTTAVRRAPRRLGGCSVP